MKKIFNSILTVSVVAALSLCVMCTNKNGNNDATGFVVNEVYKTAKAAYLCDGDTLFGDSIKVYTTTSVDIQWPERYGDCDIKALQDTIMARAFAANRKSSIDESIKSYTSDPYKDDGTKLVKVDTVPLGDDVRSYTNDVKVTRVSSSKKLVVYKMEFSTYSGGAHDLYATDYVSYDLTSGKVLDYDDLFRNVNEDDLKHVIIRKLCNDYYADDVNEMCERSSIFIENIYVSHRVYISNYDVVFVYNPYEIGPWAAGVFEVHIPYYDIEKHLTPEAIKILSDNQ